MSTTNLLLLAILITLLGLWPVVGGLALALIIGWCIMMVAILAWRVIKYYVREWKNL